MQKPNAPSWQSFLQTQFDAEYWPALERFVDSQRAEYPERIYPPESQVFAAIEHVSRADVKVVLLGQDPYHGPGQAHGFSFSVGPGVKQPPSLKNIFRELEDDQAIPVPDHGSLLAWANQGVLLLNTVLTVREGAANSHRKQGWEKFTDALIESLGQQEDSLVFVLWGNSAIAKKSLIDQKQHAIIESVHPSPLSARRGFFGSRPFSKANQSLVKFGKTPIDWQV